MEGSQRRTICLADELNGGDSLQTPSIAERESGGEVSEMKMHLASSQLRNKETQRPIVIEV